MCWMDFIMDKNLLQVGSAQGGDLCLAQVTSQKMHSHPAVGNRRTLAGTVEQDFQVQASLTEAFSRTMPLIKNLPITRDCTLQYSYFNEIYHLACKHPIHVSLAKAAT